MARMLTTKGLRALCGGVVIAAAWPVLAQEASAPGEPMPPQPSASAASAVKGADEAPDKSAPPRWGYVLGAAAVSGPPYPGAGFSSTRFRPLLAVQYGRFRISTARASAVYGFATDPSGSGVSADLLESRRWRFGLSFRIDSGRKSAEAPQLTGLPDIESTLVGRAYASYALTERWSVSGSVSQDLGNRGGGMTLAQGLGYRAPLKLLGQHTEWTASASVTYADSLRLRTRYGITPEQSATTGLPAFTPSAGYSDASMGLGVTTTIGPRWVLFANTSWSRLLGDASRSPLTLDSRSHFTSIGLAYRCCR